VSGEVLYRKWRPPSFADIVGQGPITQTLTQAVATGRTSHAYLLCGPRGTGKTSTARVLAKALNCTNRPEGEGNPCGQCESCLAIDRGNFVDLIEIDAASNRGIDAMRDLREKVRFAPTQGRSKVYIIDEAHALTADASNAFLKTLEEPPPRSVFVLATTEPHQLPPTIISRCQRFDFHRISPADVVERLGEIAEAEGTSVSPEVLRTIARAAGGSLRDGTNLLDQIITSFGANVTMEQVKELFGTGGEDRALALVKHLLAGSTTSALELINAVASEGQDLRPLHRMTVDFLRAALLMKTGVHDALELSKEAQSELSLAASNVALEHLLRSLRLFGQLTLKFDQPSPLPLELATVELSLDPEPAATRQAAAPAPQAVAPQPRQQQQPPQPQRPMPQQDRPSDVAPQPRPQQQPPQRPASTPAASDGAAPTTPAAPIAPAAQAPVFDPNATPEERLTAQWPAMLRALSRVPRRRFDVAALLRSSSKRTIDGQTLVVRFTHQSNGERLDTEMEEPKCRIEVEKVLEQALGPGFTLRIEAEDSRIAGARKSDEPGHLVRAAISIGGQVIPGAVAPIAEPTPEPAVEAVAVVEPEPVAEVVVEPEPVAEVVVEPEPEPTPEPVAKVVEPEPTPEPVAEVVEPEPTPEPMAEVVEPEPQEELVAEVVEPEPEPEPAPVAEVVEPDPQEELERVPVTTPADPAQQSLFEELPSEQKLP
jgi:DNA polymerase-3 subunit gamma/tau